MYHVLQEALHFAIEYLLYYFYLFLYLYLLIFSYRAAIVSFKISL